MLDYAVILRRFAIPPSNVACLGDYVFNVSKIWQSGARALPKETSFATMEAFLPSPNSRLHGEVTVQSLAFSRDQYYKMRVLLIKIDASDESHAVFEALKTLAVAPLKTLLLTRRGRESTYAKKEATWFGSMYVALHWNPNAEDAVEQINAASHAITTWMRGDRTDACPYSSDRKAENAAIDSQANPQTKRVELFKPKTKALDFTAEVLKGKPKNGRLLSENLRIVQRINEHQNPRADRQSDQLATLAAEIESLKKIMNRKK